MFMREAVALAKRGLWATAPNPQVGAVLVRDGVIVARGWHTACGQPHAEVECLRDAAQKNIDTSQCTLYVTLEPCNHTGKTPPCTKAVLAAGVRHVVIGALDPNPDVRGGGMRFLQENGVHVEQGLEEERCLDLLADFITWKEQRRPFVLLKLASTLDGRIATRTGHSQWVSGAESRQRVQELRKNVQAVLVGGNTFYEDNPHLGCRLPDAGQQPVAVALTSRLPAADSDFTLLRERAGETIFLTTESRAQGDAARALEGLGARVWGLPEVNDKIDLAAGLRRLHSALDCHYLLCEGGGMLGGSLLEQGLADRLLLFMAPKILGDEQARPLFAGRTPLEMGDALGLRLLETERCGEDILLTLARR